MINKETVIYYTVKEATEILKVHENTIYRWINDGTLEAEKFGDVWRIPADEIDRKRSNGSKP